MGALDQAGRAPAPDGHVAALIGTPPPLDEGEARRFLRLLDSEAKEFLFQTFTDAEDKPQPDHLAKVWPLAAFTGGLQRFYLGGAGVWVTINAAAGGRKAEHVTAVRAVWQEDDDGFEGDFPLEPSIVNESSPGRYHRYWLVEGDWPADERGRADFVGVMARMVGDYGSDPSARDISRVLRVPGFVNRKRGEPFMVRMVGGNGLRYSRAEILAAFPPLATPPGPLANGHAGTGEARAELMRKVLTGESYHGPLCSLAFRSIGAGVPPGQVVEDLRGAMNASRGPRDGRWQARFNQIPALVDSAQGKQGQRTARAEAAAEKAPSAPLRSFSMWDKLKDKKPPPPRVTHIERWMPGDDVTALFGDGGKGKTQLGLQLAYCTAASLPFLGLAVRAGAAIMLSAEEHDDELHFRGWQVSQGITLPDDAIRYPFEVVSRAAEDAQLCTFAGGLIQPTPLWTQLEEMIGDLKAAFCGLDAAADLFGGNENDRGQVRQFINMLRKPAVRFKCAMLLAGHPSVDGMKTGRGYSGSTAWNNSPRARWGFTTPQASSKDGAKDNSDGDDEPDQALRVLTLEKTNRGAPGARFRLRWDNGCFVPDSGAVTLADLAAAKARFMELLAAWFSQGRYVSHKQAASNYAPRMFSEDRSGKRHSEAAYKAAMNVLFDEVRIRVERYGSPSRGWERIVPV